MNRTDILLSGRKTAFHMHTCYFIEPPYMLQKRGPVQYIMNTYKWGKPNLFWESVKKDS